MITAIYIICCFGAFIVAMQLCGIIRLILRIRRENKQKKEELAEVPARTFPHRDTVGAEAEADALILDNLNKLFWAYQELSDKAFQQKDFKTHAVCAMAANKVVALKKKMN